MAEHRNPSISMWLQRIFNFKSQDRVSSQVGELSVPVINIEPICNIVRHSNTTSSGDITIYTTPTGKSFYLTSYGLSHMKDATCDVASGSLGLQATIDGVTRVLVNSSSITLTAGSAYRTNTLRFPIKLDAGTAIIMNGTFTLGVLIRNAFIIGYEVEDI